MGDPIDELFEERDVISARDFAKYCGVTYSTTLALCSDFDVPRIGASYVIGRDDAEEMIEAVDAAMSEAEGEGLEAEDDVDDVDDVDDADES